MNGGFGKIPSKADFFRVGYSDSQTRRFEAWLDESCLRVRETGAELQHAVRFAIHDSGDPAMLVGILRPSRDSVGRRFPLSIFTMLDWQSVQHRWSGLPLVTSTTLEAADELLVESAGLVVDGVGRRVDSLWAPSSSDLQQTDEVCRNVLEQTPWLSVTTRLFGERAPLENAAYAFRTLRTALARPQGIVECPIEVDLDLFFWLELSRRATRAESLAFAWTEDPTPRLIVATGAIPQILLLALNDPQRDLQEIWPLRSTRQAALDVAMQALGPALEAVRGGSIEQLLHGLAQVVDA